MSPGDPACRTCGESHGEMPRVLGSPAPDHALAVPEEEREERVVATADTCIVDGEHHYILGRLEIPVHGEEEPFVYLVWSSLSPGNYARAESLWNTPGRESEPPYFGWLSTRLPGYPETLNLKVRVHTRPVGERPLLELEPTDHPLAVEQREGISPARMRQIVEAALHP